MQKLIFHCTVFMFILPLCSCLSQEDQARKLETEIRASVISETAALASLTCVYRIIYTNVKDRIVFSDDMYIQQDEATVDYGFSIDKNNINVVFENGQQILRVRLFPAETLPTDRHTIYTERTHADYKPEADIDAEINRELDSLKKEYGKRALKEAEHNIKNFFTIIAAKYDLELDFAVELTHE